MARNLRAITLHSFCVRHIRGFTDAQVRTGPAADSYLL
jgi:hypothetical protein